MPIHLERDVGCMSGRLRMERMTGIGFGMLFSLGLLLMPPLSDLPQMQTKLIRFLLTKCEQRTNHMDPDLAPGVVSSNTEMQDF